MKVSVNATTLIIGGGIQLGVSFIEYATRNSNIEWQFLISEEIFSNLEMELKNDPRIIVVKKSPAKIFQGYKSRIQIKCMIKKFIPDIIYSLGFPSYIVFKQTEMGHYTNPWEINPEPLPWQTIDGLINRLITRLGILYRIMWARRANFIETQTEAAKLGISKRAHYSLDNIFVVPNSPNSIFVKQGEKIKDIGKLFEKENNVFCLSAPYGHKNLDLIPFVASKLKHDFKYQVKFILTIPPKSKLWIDILEKSNKLNVSEYIDNVGPLKLSDCIDFYKKSKIVFLPTLLEIFSATFLEAMAMKVPIITTNLEFAHDNCKNAALFFNHGDAKHAASLIYEISTNKALYLDQVISGSKILNSYPSANNKYISLFKYFKRVVENGK